jgi:hypothetical protein
VSLRQFRKKRQVAEMIFVGCVFLSMLTVAGARSASASSCIACHTDETALKANLSPVVEKKSAMTSGAG